MSVLYFDGFDHYATADITKKWNTSYGSPQISTDAGIEGYGLLLGAQSIVTKSIPDTQTVIIGFAFRATTLANRRICFFRDEATIQVSLNLSSTGKLIIYRGDGTVLGTSGATLAANEWTYLQMKVTVSNTAGYVELRIGKNVEVLASSINTQVSTNAYQNTIGFGFQDNFAPPYFHYDNLYILDTAGARSNDFLGVQRVSAIFPLTAGTYSQWVTFGASSAINAIKEHQPDGDTSYLRKQGSTTDQELHYYDRVSTRLQNIAAVAHHQYARKEWGNTAPITSLAMPGTMDGVVGGTVIYTASPLYIQTEYSYHTVIREQNPANLAITPQMGTWTGNAINGLQGGSK